jgi:hypothetical protein
MCVEPFSKSLRVPPEDHHHIAPRPQAGGTRRWRTRPVVVIELKQRDPIGENAVVIGPRDARRRFTVHHAHAASDGHFFDQYPVDVEQVAVRLSAM